MILIGFALFVGLLIFIGGQKPSITKEERAVLNKKENHSFSSVWPTICKAILS